MEDERCKETVYKRDTYRRTGRGKTGIRNALRKGALFTVSTSRGLLSATRQVARDCRGPSP